MPNVAEISGCLWAWGERRHEFGAFLGSAGRRTERDLRGPFEARLAQVVSDELFSLMPIIPRYYCRDIYDYITTKLLDGGRRSRHCRIRGDVSRHHGDGGRHNSAGGIECYECILERCQFASIMLMP